MKPKKSGLELYQKEIPEPTVLFNALERGLPNSAGIAVGVERLIGTLTENRNLFYFLNINRVFFEKFTLLLKGVKNTMKFNNNFRF